MSKLTFSAVNLDIPEDVNFILGQSHFIKTVEDLHEALVTTSAGIKFGLAFCEASGPRLIRYSGNDESMIDLAKKNIKKIAAGHTFIIFLNKGYYPVNVLKTMQMVPEVVNIYCATANSAQVLVGETEKGRAVIGVIDGGTPLGFEDEKEKDKRRRFLRDIGYKL